ncbi:MAG: hypothetical protein PHZ00_03885 [Candidatus Peribacteraceae bacterium]|nr:hypothetical protein [Candidatus Peribacteraceae bacterium]
MTGWIILAAPFVFTLALAVFVLILQRRRTLRGNAKSYIISAWTHAQNQSIPQLQIIEGDKVLDKALHFLRYRGSLGEKLKSAGPRFKNLNDVWWAHKLRNSISHELNVVPTQADADRAMKAYEGALRDLGL